MLTAGGRACREIAQTFDDWAWSFDTARLDELVRLRRSTWLSDLLAARGLGEFPTAERAWLLVRLLLDIDLRSIEVRIAEGSDIAARASASLATELVRNDPVLREKLEGMRSLALRSIAEDPMLAVVRKHVIELRELAEDFDRIVSACVSEDASEPAASETAAELEMLSGTALKVLAVLEDHRYMSQKDIAEEVGVSTPTVRYHLPKLERLGFVERRKNGQGFRRTRAGTAEMQRTAT